MDREAGPSTPLERIERRLGGIKAVADLADRSVKSVYRWRSEGGLVPLPAQRRMVRNARRRRIELDYPDFAPRAGEVVT